MIEQISGHITEKQVLEILKSIITRYKKFLKLMASVNFQTLFSDEYSSHRKRNTATWAIYSAFTNKKNFSGGLRACCFKYAKGHTIPKLENDSILILIMSSHCDFSSQYLQQFYMQNAENFTHEKLFCYFKFEINRDDRLCEISLCLPDENGNVIAQEVLVENLSNLRAA